MEKLAQICQILIKETFQNRHIFLISSSKEPRIKEDFDFFFFLLSYLLCSQIWLNHFMDDSHFIEITNSGYQADKYGYQKIKYPVITYNHGSQKELK